MNHALIVGATGGIGFAFVEELVKDRSIAKIYATYRRDDRDRPLFTLADRLPDRLICLPIDLCDESQIINSIDLIQQNTPKLHLVINCVGILHDETLQPEKSLRHIDTENMLRYFQINSIGGVLLAKHLQKTFKHPERSVFATISAKVGSISDNRLGGWYGYRASKAALNMLLRNVAIEYARTCPQNIVVSLHPGTTATPLSEPFQKNVPAEKLFSPQKTASQLLAVINNLKIEDSGEFFSWDGTRLPY